MFLEDDEGASKHVGVLTYLLLTHSMQQSPSWEVNRFSATQEIPRILWNPKIYYRIHKCPPPVPILSQFDPFHTPHILLPEDPSYIILPSTPGPPKWPLSLRFPHQTLRTTLSLPHTRYMPRPSHSHVTVLTIYEIFVNIHVLYLLVWIINNVHF